jgi:hypothetical protein
MIRHQEIRLSQMIFTHGPGSIIETVNGPRLIPRADMGLFSQQIDPEDHALDLPSLSSILGNRRVFRLPSNALLGKAPTLGLYTTRPFPKWKLCVDHELLYIRQCPGCAASGKWSRRTEAIRFVVACGAGHLDEVNWYQVVHSRKCSLDSGPDHYHWSTRGGSLSNTEIECPVCRQKNSLGTAYNRDFKCSGRFPEREAPDGAPERGNCRENARIIQRQATSLRIPELLTFITVPPLETHDHKLLSRPRVRESFETWLIMRGHWNRSGGTLTSRPVESEVRDWLINIAPPGTGGLRDDERANLLEQNMASIWRTVEEILTFKPATTMNQILRDEFRSLRQGAVTGVPSGCHDGARGRSLILINPSRVRTVARPPGHLRLQVTPIEKLHTVIVQTGYRRAVKQAGSDLLGTFVGIGAPWRGSEWLPGHEAMGEGLFITLPGDAWHPDLAGPDAARWLRAWQQADDDSVPPGGSHGRDVFHPVFIWWHTLTHLLIRALAVESGYSLSSIRERQYFEESEDGSKARGGVLLYTTQMGADGTLGGLIALVPRFEPLLESALDMAGTCSADPLCQEHRFEDGRQSGAACYACSLISETSCEHRNLWLDRNVLLENLP